MTNALVAILPVFLVILLGSALRRAQLVPDSFWMPAEKLTYFVTFPALLTANLAGAEMGAMAWGPMAGVLVTSVLVVSILTLRLRRKMARRLNQSGAAFTSVFQGAIRPNTYIGLALAAALYGQQGITLTAICIAAVIPLVNALAVVCLSHFGHGQGAMGMGGVLRGIATNPLILACVIGVAMNVSGVGLPPVLGPFLEILARAALPMGLLAVGAGLSLGAVRQDMGSVSASAVAKLLIQPLLALTGCAVMGLDPTASAVAVLYAALPCSASSYVLARRMGGDGPLMAAIISTQTLLAAATIPLWVVVLSTTAP